MDYPAYTMATIFDICGFELAMSDEAASMKKTHAHRSAEIFSVAMV